MGLHFISDGRCRLFSRLETLFISFNFTKINEKKNNKSNISLIKSHEQRFFEVVIRTFLKPVAKQPLIGRSCPSLLFRNVNHKCQLQINYKIQLS